MEITEVKISLRDEAKLRGFANITLDGMFVVRGLKIIRGWKRYFVAMPTRKRKDGTHSDIAHPITTDFRKEMERIVLDKYWQTNNKIEKSRIAAF